MPYLPLNEDDKQEWAKYWQEVEDWFKGFEEELERKMNIIIRIKNVKAREYLARRLGFEILGHLIGGHAFPKDWKDEDWEIENLPPFMGKRRVREVLGEDKP